MDTFSSQNFYCFQRIKFTVIMYTDLKNNCWNNNLFANFVSFFYITIFNTTKDFMFSLKSHLIINKTRINEKIIFLFHIKFNQSDEIIYQHTNHQSPTNLPQCIPFSVQNVIITSFRHCDEPRVTLFLNTYFTNKQYVTIFPNITSNFFHNIKFSMEDHCKLILFIFCVLYVTIFIL